MSRLSVLILVLFSHHFAFSGEALDSCKINSYGYKGRLSIVLSGQNFVGILERGGSTPVRFENVMRSTYTGDEVRKMMQADETIRQFVALSKVKSKEIAQLQLYNLAKDDDGGVNFGSFRNAKNEVIGGFVNLGMMPLRCMP